MNSIDFQEFVFLMKTPPRSQNYFLESESVMPTRYNTFAFSGLWYNHKISKNENRPKKNHLLPNKLPNEF